MNKQELIMELSKIYDFSKFYNKGGTSKFNKEYPKLLNVINFNTKEMQIYDNNKKLIAKVLYLTKYSGKIENIIHNDNIMIYDYKLNDFKIPHLNAAQKQWDFTD